MKKIIIYLLVFSMLFSLISCTTAGNDSETKPETTDNISEEIVTVTDGFDFTRAEIREKIILFITDAAPHIYDEGAEGFVSQKPEIAEVDESGAISLKSEGVTLIGYEINGMKKAAVLCVLGEDTPFDRSTYQDAMLFEVGETFVHTAPAGTSNYVSSDNSVVNVDRAPTLSFEKSGYAYVTVSNASRPFSYSFIVYERT